jgi:hypothetical protein
MNYLINKILEDLESNLNKKDVQYYIFGRPYHLPASELEKGVIMVEPISTSVQAVTTGITDEETKEVQIILAKVVKDDFYKNSSKETGSAYLTRIFENKDTSNQLQTDTIRYIVRNNLRQWGLLQPQITINYSGQVFEEAPEGTVTGIMTISTIDHFTQILA